MKASADISLRVLAAFIGGYLLTALANLAWVLSWPGHRADAVYYGTLFPWLIYFAVMIWAFSARSALKVWAVILAVAGGLLSWVALAWYLK
ncbi:hypothetical protein LG198_04705 [Methylobacillus arboreus]|uniref:hypothetical protein n=1 Tax=Methylobacillus arboreus TaxID=755170 RepID=UPI001E300610|nr:hypothetical protein [Methylobacillus arboreus]MCB5190028.1 hypothetical protein [Methylobacillus arboreus]